MYEFPSTLGEQGISTSLVLDTKRLEAEGVSVPSRGTGNINRARRPPGYVAHFSFRPLSGNREYQHSKSGGGSNLEHDSVSVPSRGTGNINAYESGIPYDVTDSFRPLSGNREYQREGRPQAHAERAQFPSPLGEQGISTCLMRLIKLTFNARFRPLSGNREYQRYGQISYFMIQGESIFPHLKHVAIVILNIRHRKTFSSHAEHSSEHGPYTKALHDPVIR